MRHLLIPAALVVGLQPAIAGVTSPNGATLLAVLLLGAWGALQLRRAH